MTQELTFTMDEKGNLCRLNYVEGDSDALFPMSDVSDFNKGARYIPGQVTDARRRGEHVQFNPEKHQWTMPDGTKIPAGRSDYATE